MTRSTMSASRDTRYRLAWWTLFLAFICGGILRWVWIDDMEWKDDEQWSYRMSQEVGRTQPWPWVGMATSLHFPNPGLSVWIFVAIGRIVSDPTSMVHLIVLLNIIGLIGFAAAIRFCVPASEREPWVWGLAIEAVSPYAIRMSRKLWPPSILLPLLLALWVSHRYRLSRGGAFAWGLAGAVIGQVHLSGWFVAMGLAIGTMIAELCGRWPRSRFWHWWFLGTVLGLLPAIPWARELTTSSLTHATSPDDLTSFGRIGGHVYGLVAAASSTIPYAFLGIGNDIDEFLSGPIWDGLHVHFYEGLNVYLIIVFSARIVARLIEAIATLTRRWSRRKRTAGPDDRLGGVSSSPSSSPDSGAECPSVSFYLWSAVVMPFFIMFVATNVYFYHYYFVFCPLLFVMIAVWMLPWRRALLGMVVAQALMSVLFLTYIHRKGGVINGEYRASYARQHNR
jgi:hypothetical protein